MFLLRQFFSTIPLELEEAARMDGCGPLRVFWHVILPLSKAPLATLGIFTFMGTWNAFEGPLIFTDSLEMRTLPIGITIFQGQYNIEYGPTDGGGDAGGDPGVDRISDLPEIHHQGDLAHRAGGAMTVCLVLPLSGGAADLLAAAGDAFEVGAADLGSGGGGHGGRSVYSPVEVGSAVK